MMPHGGRRRGLLHANRNGRWIRLKLSAHQSFFLFSNISPHKNKKNTFLLKNVGRHKKFNIFFFTFFVNSLTSLRQPRTSVQRAPA
jgi:hypothetical protein